MTARVGNYALSRYGGTASIGGMAEQKQNQSQKTDKTDLRNPGEDDPRRAPESGEPTETGRADQQGARGDRAGERDESGRQGK